MWTILSRTSGATSVDGPSRVIFFWLVGVFLLTLLPHSTQMPTWLTASIVIALVVRCIAEIKHWPLPTTTSTGVVAFCLLGAIFLEFHTIMGKDAGTPFMAGLLAIKFYELRGPRDITLIIFSSFFAVMSSLLFSQSIESFIYCLIMMWLLTGILLRTYMGDRTDCRLLRMLRISSLIFAQALPLTILLFFFFPRYSGHLALTMNDTLTGLSDRVEPGSIERLLNDDSNAMRVVFDKGVRPPPSDQMYWRAIVLWNFDGRAWTRGVPVKKGGPIYADAYLQQPNAQPKSTEYRQTITLWAQNQRWIPALDRPVGGASDAETVTTKPWSVSLVGDVLVPPIGVVDYKRRYVVTSCPFTSEREPTPEEYKAALQLPDHIDQRIRDLADQLYAAHPGPIPYRDAVLHYFQTTGFRLSMEPGRLTGDPVAQFLFETKSGFCEHYASAFGVLMRLKGVPTRMVVGYRGGDLDPFGSPPFYLITQSCAHAWDEIWVASKTAPHWERVDATINLAGEGDALAANAGEAADNDDLALDIANRRFTLVSAKFLPQWARIGIRDMQMRRQEMEAQWDDWVFSYDPDAQDKLAEKLGAGHYAWIVLLSACLTVIGIVTCVVAWLLARQKRLAPVEDFYSRFCRRMAQRGFPREPWEGPTAYTARLAAKLPTHRQRIETAGSIVAEYRYAPGDKRPTGDLEALLREVFGRRMTNAERQAALDRHVAKLLRCRKCPKMLKPVVSGGPVMSRVLLVGQAPGDKEPVLGRPFAWTAGKKLFRWFSEYAGVDEATFRARVYMAAVCRCFPGKRPTGGDRVPDNDEIVNCSSWMKAEFELLEPRLVIAVGKLAILQFMPCERLDTVIGTVHPMRRYGASFEVVPLPHPSGASPWPYQEPGRTLLPRAMKIIAGHSAWRESVLRK